MDGSDFHALDFLVIGGMKCGSTTLYHDLAAQSNVFLCEKEFDLLSASLFSVKHARQAYQIALAAKRPNQISGDVSTTYAKLPDYPDVAARAYETLGANLKIVYVVREPVSRIVSQHYHMHSWRGPGHMSADINACVREHSSLLNYSCYAMQLAPWRSRFGDGAIRIILFEEFVANRAHTMRGLAQFLGFQPRLSAVDSQSISNRSEGKPVLNRFWLALYRHPAYHRTLRRLMPSSLRSELRRVLLPKAPPRPPTPSLETVDLILSRVADEELQLRKLMGRTQPLWDFGAVRATYA